MAANKKYLSLEEAAALLKIKTDELIRLREKSEIRGFADRGTWKFKADDVEEFRRRRQPDSDPDLPIMGDDDDFDATPSKGQNRGSFDDSGSALDDGDDLGRQATVIRKGREMASDSDVRLVLDDDLKGSLTGSSGDVPVMNLSQSDSDVRLVGDPAFSFPTDSDSDVKLVSPMLGPDSDSDVKLVTPPESGASGRGRLGDSDSDVRLAPLSGSGSRSSNLASDSDVALLPPMGSNAGAIDLDLTDDGIGGSALLDLPDDDAIVLPGDSGIRLSGDSGIQIRQPADSGINLEGADSGIRLGGGDSAIRLGGDSGFRLAPAGGSSKKLNAGSGIKLKGGSSVKLKKNQVDDDLNSTSPMLLAQSNDDDDLNATTPMLLGGSGALSGTDLEIPSLDEDEELDLGGEDEAVVMFDDEETDETAQTVIKKGNKKTLDESAFDLDEDDDELEVSDEILGEDDELEDLDAFDSDDDEFDESFEAGASQIGFGRKQDKVVVPQERDWGTGFFIGLWVSTAVLVVGAMLSVDLLRATWAAGDMTKIYDGGLIGNIASLFKS